MKFGTKLVNILKDRGITQKQLAEESGVSEYTMSAVCRNTRHPQWDTMCLISSALNMQLSELVDGVNDFTLN